MSGGALVWLTDKELKHVRDLARAAAVLPETQGLSKGLIDKVEAAYEQVVCKPHGAGRKLARDVE